MSVHWAHNLLLVGWDGWLDDDDDDDDDDEDGWDDDDGWEMVRQALGVLAGQAIRARTD